MFLVFTSILMWPLGKSYNFFDAITYIEKRKGRGRKRVFFFLKYELYNNMLIR